MDTFSPNWDVLLIQEDAQHKEEKLEEVVGGHLFFTARPGTFFRSTCILLNNRWADACHSPEFSSIADRLSSLKLTISNLKLQNFERLIFPRFGEISFSTILKSVFFQEVESLNSQRESPLKTETFKISKR